MPDPSRLPLPLAARSAPAALLARALGAATALRGARAFHPRGQAHAARVVVTGGLGTGARVLDEPAEHPAVVRLSRALGLPRPLPDAEGLALRLPGLGVGGAPLDLLVNTAWRYVFVPRFLSATWSTLLPYDTGSGRRLVLGARPTREGFTLLAAGLLGPWREWGRVVLGAPFDGEDLAFAPTVGAPDLVPVRFLRGLRAQAYDRSQAARAPR